MGSSNAGSRSRRRGRYAAWRIKAVAGIASLLGLLAASPAAIGAGNAGQIDRSFGGDGKVTVALPTEENFTTTNYALPFEFASGRVAMARAGGKLVVANAKAIVRFLPNGRRDPGFGGNGAVPIGPIEGSLFRLADVVVDSQGRILVAGTTKPRTRNGMIGPPVPGPIPSVATIRRYLPNGQLDPEFGGNGILNTHLGAKPATFEGQAYPEAAVGVVGLAVDAADRPIVTGSAVIEVGKCPQSQNRYQASQGIVARLTVGGAADASFGDNGLKSLGGLGWLGAPILTPAGLVLSGGAAEPCPQGGPLSPTVLVRLLDDGGLDAGFGEGGFWSRPFTRVSDVALAPGGKLVLLTRTIELSRGEWIESRGAAARLRSNGSLDRGFGRAGRLELKLGKQSFLEAIAADAKGRVLLLGDVWRPSKRGENFRSGFLLVRTTVAGEPDPQFGRDGRVMTGFGGRTKVRATELLLNRGHIVGGGKVTGPRSGNGFAIARYLGA
jgi:uncharacterized delta-60 repeat protein